MGPKGPEQLRAYMRYGPQRVNSDEETDVHVHGLCITLHARCRGRMLIVVYMHINCTLDNVLWQGHYCTDLRLCIVFCDDIIIHPQTAENDSNNEPSAVLAVGTVY